MKSIYMSLIILAFIMIVNACNTDNSNPLAENKAGNNNSEIYIVKFNFDNVPTLQGNSDKLNSSINNLLKEYSISNLNVTDYYTTLFPACAIKLNSTQYNALRLDKNIEYIEKDQIIKIDDQIEFNEKNESLQAQTTPWGITSVGGSVGATSNTGVAWIVDTGIYLTHSDLNVNTTLSKTFIKSGQDAQSANDLNGHGSHCAGIVAAKNNSIGSVGVCANASVIAVKVLDRNGSGSISNIISGLAYVGNNLVANKLNAVNMSLGGGVSQSLDDAVKALANKGAHVCVAAGNSSANATNYSPARVENTRVYTISAHSPSYSLSSYSNWGTPVYYSAPGDNIYSTYKSNSYATLSGTSMATPHVVGILLANNGTINYSGTITGDKDSNPDKRAVR